MGPGMEFQSAVAREPRSDAFILHIDGRRSGDYIDNETPSHRITFAPRRTAREVVLPVEPALEIVELRSAELHGHGARAWFCLSRKRTEPAQASTRHG